MDAIANLVSGRFFKKKPVVDLEKGPKPESTASHRDHIPSEASLLRHYDLYIIGSEQCPVCKYLIQQIGTKYVSLFAKFNSLSVIDQNTVMTPENITSVFNKRELFAKLGALENIVIPIILFKLKDVPFTQKNLLSIDTNLFLRGFVNCFGHIDILAIYMIGMFEDAIVKTNKTMKKADTFHDIFRIEDQMGFAPSVDQSLDGNIHSAFDQQEDVHILETLIGQRLDESSVGSSTPLTTNRSMYHIEDETNTSPTKTASVISSIDPEKTESELTEVSITA